jgi:hypothetical protein
MKSPPKRSAPGREIAGAAKLRLPQSYRFCPHTATRTEMMPSGSVHHAREVCAVCRAFIRWLPKPQTIERERTNAFRLARLGMCERLSKWERDFVHHLAQQRKLSPRQQVLVERLYREYLEAKAP